MKGYRSAPLKRALRFDLRFAGGVVLSLTVLAAFILGIHLTL